MQPSSTAQSVSPDRHLAVCPLIDCMTDSMYESKQAATAPAEQPCTQARDAKLACLSLQMRQGRSNMPAFACLLSPSTKWAAVRLQFA
eukprot:scaffold169127_cov18-Tisochrysis_lutea.AAC.1